MTEESSRPVPQGLAIERAGISRRQLIGRGAGVAGVAIGSGAIASFLAACGNSTDSSGTTGGVIAAGGLLKVAVRQEPDTLDPAKSPLSSSYEVFTNLNACLVGIEPNGRIVPSLASKWTNPNNRTWAFDLRDGTTFHTGEPVTAEDVKFSLDRIMAKETVSPLASYLTSVEGIDTEGPRRVVLHLNEPYTPILTVLTRMQIQSMKAVETGDPGRKPVGAGPFVFVEWVQGDHITLKRNENWWGAKDQPHLDEVNFRFQPTSPSVVTAVRSGELNYTSSVPPNLVSSVAEDPAFNFTTSTTSGYPSMIGFNLKKTPLDNELFRQAIAWAIDRDEVHKVAYFASGQAGSEEVGNGSPWYDHEDPYVNGPDLDKAKSLLEQSGVSTPVTIELMANSGTPEFARVGEVLEQQLKPLGINIEIEQVETSIWLKRMAGGEFDLTVYFNETVIDPDQMYALMAVTHAPLNVVSYSNPDFDRLIAQAAAELEMSKRKELYAQARKIIFKELPFFYIHYDTPNYLAGNDVLDVTARPSLELALQTVGFSQQS